MYALTHYHRSMLSHTHQLAYALTHVHTIARKHARGTLVVMQTNTHAVTYIKCTVLQTRTQTHMHAHMPTVTHAQSHIHAHISAHIHTKATFCTCVLHHREPDK